MTLCMLDALINHDLIFPIAVDIVRGLQRNARARPPMSAVREDPNKEAPESSLIQDASSKQRRTALCANGAGRDKLGGGSRTRIDAIEFPMSCVEGALCRDGISDSSSGSDVLIMSGPSQRSARANGGIRGTIAASLQRAAMRRQSEHDRPCGSMLGGRIR
jgi:hypothetical protein